MACFKLQPKYIKLCLWIWYLPDRNGQRYQHLLTLLPFFTRAIPKGVTFGVCFMLCNVHVCKSLEEILCGWRGYKPSINNRTSFFWICFICTQFCQPFLHGEKLVRKKMVFLDASDLALCTVHDLDDEHFLVCVTHNKLPVAGRACCA